MIAKELIKLVVRNRIITDKKNKQTALKHGAYSSTHTVKLTEHQPGESIGAGF